MRVGPDLLKSRIRPVAGGASAVLALTFMCVRTCIQRMRRVFDKDLAQHVHEAAGANNFSLSREKTDGEFSEERVLILRSPSDTG